MYDSFDAILSGLKAKPGLPKGAVVAGANDAHVLEADIPIILTSRSTSMNDKLDSILLCTVLS